MSAARGTRRPRGRGGVRPPTSGRGRRTSRPGCAMTLIGHAALASLLCIGLAAGLDPGGPALAADQQTGEGWGALAGVALALGVAVAVGLLRLARARRAEHRREATNR